MLWGESEGRGEQGEELSKDVVSVGDERPSDPSGALECELHHKTGHGLRQGLSGPVSLGH